MTEEQEDKLVDEAIDAAIRFNKEECDGDASADQEWWFQMGYMEAARKYMKE